MAKKQQKCTECQAVIPKERIEALPDVKLCVKCAEKSEEGQKIEPFFDGYNHEDCMDILSGDD